MDDLQSLELLSLTTKVAAELQNHTGSGDKTLAEFLIDQRLQSNTLADFKAAIGDDLPASLLDGIDRLVRTLHPQFRAKSNGAIKTSASNGTKAPTRADLFKGLAIPDKELDQPSWTAATPNNGHSNDTDDTFALLENLAPGCKKEPAGGEGLRVDDTFAALESLAPGGRQSKRGNKDDIGSTSARDRHDRHDRRHDRDGRQETKRGRERSVSPYDDAQSRRKHRHRTDRDYSRSPRRDRGGYSSDEPDRHRRTKSRRDREPKHLDDAPVLEKIYDGHVTGVKDFGAFVALDGIRGRAEGLVHVSAIQSGTRINHPSDVVNRNDRVKVKIVKIDGTRLSLSMKDVDQVTGQDIGPARFVATGANRLGLGGAPGGGDDGYDDDGDDTARIGRPTERVPVIEDVDDRSKRRRKNGMTSPERWEIKQLIAAGALSAQDFPNLDDEPTTGANGEMAEEEEDVDIEVREEEPPFLAGQTKLSLELSPIRVVKAPDGSLNRAAQSGDERARERRELREQAHREEAARKAAEVDRTEQWQDPMGQDQKLTSDFGGRSSGPRPGFGSGPGGRGSGGRGAENPDGPPGSELPEWKRISRGTETMGKRTNMSIAEQRQSLPVFKFRSQFLDAVREHQLLVVVGDTGSGKTTQLTQYLAEDGHSRHGIIGCTQPRRVAAMSVAERVAKEVGVPLGAEVGYTIRFEDKTSPSTQIKYMTDGIMQREILLDPLLSKYSVIMLDEAHERSIATDILFGLLKKAIRRRTDLKVIVTSATLDADKFSEYFNKCPIFSIPGRTFPVEIMYSREPETDYLDAALTTVMQIHLTEPPGDVLLFLTGKEEIDTSCEILYERMKALGPSVPELIILPVYGALPSEIASRIFEPAPPFSRKIVIATNIAETSITIDGIYYVVDPGFVKQKAYDAKLGMDRLQVTPISQAQAKQRAGRAGRTGPGKCFRLYTEAAYQSEMVPTTIPEIQRQNLSNTILILKAMGINDLLHFDFMDPPPTNTLLTALEELYALSALDDEGLLTRLGRQMADFPVDPALAKTLIASAGLACSDEVLTIVSMISATETIFHRPREKQQQADQKKAKFHDRDGDHLTLLNVFNRWRDAKFAIPWCYDHFVQPQAMRRVRDVRDQLKTILDRHRLAIVSCGSSRDRVRRALCSGFFRNAARKDPTDGYKTVVEGTIVYMHPSSSLFGKPAEHVIYHSLVETTKEYMHYVTAIDPRWLAEAAPTFFKIAPSNRLSKRRREERIVPLANQYGRDDDWRLSTQRRQGRGGGGGTWG